MRLQLTSIEPPIHGLRIANDVKVMLLEVDDPPAGLIGDEGIADRPFLRDDPVERLGAGGDLSNFDSRDPIAQVVKSVARSWPSDASADGNKARAQP